jgi:RHS repeat-associated protein
MKKFRAPSFSFALGISHRTLTRCRSKYLGGALSDALRTVLRLFSVSALLLATGSLSAQTVGLEDKPQDADVSTMDASGSFENSSGTVTRLSVDLSVPGSVGQYPLKVIRRAGLAVGLWTVNFTEGGIDGDGMDLPDYMEVVSPEGETNLFCYDTGMGWFNMGGGRATFSGGDIRMPDGRKIVLKYYYDVDYVEDANGVRYDYEYTGPNPNEFSRITDPTGRWIQFSWATMPYFTFNVRQIVRAESSDGNWVEYNRSSPFDIVINYADGTTSSVSSSQDGSSYWRDFRDSHLTKGVPNARYVWAKHINTHRLSQYYGVANSQMLNYVVDLGTGTAVSSRSLRPAGNGWWYDDVVTETREGVSRTIHNTVIGGGGWVGNNYVAIPRPTFITDFQGNGWSYAYNYDGLSHVTDPLGRVTQFQREAIHGNITQITLPDGTFKQWTYSNANEPYFVSQVTNERGHTTSYNRLGNGLVSQVNYPDGTNEGWSYNQFNQPTVHRLGNGAHEWFEYDGGARLLRHWLPSFSGQQASVTYTYYPDGHPWEDRVWTQTDAAGHTTTYEYDRAFVNGVQGTVACAGRGLVTKVTNHDGTYKTFEYDVYGNKIWEENELRERTSYEYDSVRRPTKTINPLGQETTNVYSGSETSASVRETILPSGKKKGYRYDANLRKTEEFTIIPGQTTTTTQTVYKIESGSGTVLDIDGYHVVQYGYYDGPYQKWVLDSNGSGGYIIRNLGYGEVLDLDGYYAVHYGYYGSLGQQWALDDVGNGTCIIRNLGNNNVLDLDGYHAVQYGYYGGGNQHWRFTPVGSITNTVPPTNIEENHIWYRYDAVGNVTKLTQQVDGGVNREMTFEYSNRNRKITEYAPLGRTTHWQYDAAGNVTQVTNPDNTTTSKTYDTMNRVGTSTDEMGRVTTYTHTPLGKVHTITDPRGFTYEHLYDAAGRLTERKYPTASGVGYGSSERWEYNADGTVSAHYNRSNQKLNYSYDNRSRETHRWWDGNAAPEVYTSYNGASRVTSRTNPNGILGYTYDAAGQVTSEAQTNYGGPTITASFTYDVDGGRASFAAPSVWLGYTYNASSSLSAIQFGGGVDWATFTYNQAGQRQTRVYNNGTRSNYAYDGAGRLNYLHTYRTNDNSGVLNQRFGYDLRDRRTWQVRDDNLGDTFSYQADSQLLEFRQHVYRPDLNFSNPAIRADSFGYDANGNRTSRNEGGTVTAYQADALNQYTSVTGAAIGHNDGRGNITQWQDWNCTYDADNRLTHAAKSGYQVWFYYDAMGRLSKVNRNGQWEHRYYDGSQVFLRTRPDASWIDLTVWGPTSDEVISRYTPSLGWQFYHQDSLNSTVAITDTNRNVVERYLYDAYGQEDILDGAWGARTVSAISNPWMFTGQELMADLGLNNYKNRFYNADLGRFIQQDPIRFDAGDLNLYRYCGNDPFNFTDPNGLDAVKDADTQNKVSDAATSQNTSGNTSQGSDSQVDHVAKDGTLVMKPFEVNEPRGGAMYGLQFINWGPAAVLGIGLTARSFDGYGDRYIQHIETYAITLNPAVVAGLIGGGAMPKTWVPRTGGRGPALGSGNPLTSVPRAFLGSSPLLSSTLARTGFAGVAITGAAIGGYNTGVLLGGLGYAAFPGSNGLSPP